MSSKFWILAVLWGGLVLAGCTQATEPVRQVRTSSRSRDAGQATYQVDAGPETLRLSTRVEVTERSMVTGRTAHLVLSVTNHEREPVTLRFPDSCQLLYVVYDWRGTEVSEGYSCFFFGTRLTLEPGETVEQTESWDASRYDEQLRARVALPPGPYRIHAFLRRYGYLSPPFVMRLLDHERRGEP